MSDDFDPDALAATATGEESASTTQQAAETATETTADHAAAEGTEPNGDVGSQSTLREMLLSTGPDPALNNVEDPWNPDEGGTTRIYRGLMKAVNIDGMPAIVDVVIGACEAVVQLKDELPGESQEANTDDQGESDDVDPSEVMSV